MRAVLFAFLIAGGVLADIVEEIRYKSGTECAGTPTSVDYYDNANCINSGSRSIRYVCVSGVPTLRIYTSAHCTGTFKSTPSATTCQTNYRMRCIPRPPILDATEIVSDVTYSTSDCAVGTDTASSPYLKVCTNKKRVFCTGQDMIFVTYADSNCQSRTGFYSLLPAALGNQCAAQRYGGSAMQVCNFSPASKTVIPTVKTYGNPECTGSSSQTKYYARDSCEKLDNSPAWVNTFCDEHGAAKQSVYLGQGCTGVLNSTSVLPAGCDGSTGTAKHFSCSAAPSILNATGTVANVTYAGASCTGKVSSAVHLTACSLGNTKPFCSGNASVVVHFDSNCHTKTGVYTTSAASDASFRHCTNATSSKFICNYAPVPRHSGSSNHPAQPGILGLFAVAMALTASMAAPL